jgi:hypothetical protein
MVPVFWRVPSSKKVPPGKEPMGVSPSELNTRVSEVVVLEHCPGKPKNDPQSVSLTLVVPGSSQTTVIEKLLRVYPCGAKTVTVQVSLTQLPEARPVVSVNDRLSDESIKATVPATACEGTTNQSTRTANSVRARATELTFIPIPPLGFLFLGSPEEISIHPAAILGSSYSFAKRPRCQGFVQAQEVASEVRADDVLISCEERDGVHYAGGKQK